MLRNLGEHGDGWWVPGEKERWGLYKGSTDLRAEVAQFPAGFVEDEEEKELVFWSDFL